MRQQINLYQPIFSEARKPLSALTVASVLAAVLLALLAFSVHTQLRVNKTAARVETLREQQTEQETLLNQATEASTQRSNPAAIESRVKQLTTAVDERTRALQLLKSGAAGQTMGFADRMEGLARRHVDGLWIDSLIISGTNGSMSIAGATLNADTVPEYLKNLAREPVLNGTRFDEFVIERPVSVASKSEPTLDGTEADKPTVAVNRFIRFKAGSSALATAPAGES
jgi:hypothetical protein